MNKKYIAVTLIIGWFLGAASGLLLSHLCHMQGWHWEHGHHMRDRLYKEINLTPEQKTRVDAIFKTTHQKIQQVFSNTRSQMEAVRKDTRSQIRQLLTPEQQGAFDKLDAEWEARFQKKMDRMFGK